MCYGPMIRLFPFSSLYFSMGLLPPLAVPIEQFLIFNPIILLLSTLSNPPPSTAPFRSKTSIKLHFSIPKYCSQWPFFTISIALPFPS